MRRYLLAAVVVVADTALLVAGHRDSLAVWVVPLYALAVTLVVALRRRAPVAAFVAALVLAALTGGAFVLLLWASYQAGRAIVSRSGTAVVVGAALGWLGLQLAGRPADPQGIGGLLSTCLVFVALPLLAGRYLAQHERLVSALDRHNRRLRRERELLAERERLCERLRIAREMHDSLGHRLSLVSLQAAALEVAELPAGQRQAVRQLAGAARGAMDELYELVGALRSPDETVGRPPGLEAIGAVVEEFQRAGVPVVLRRRGAPRPLSAAAGQAAYRVVEEGLTNAAKHAPGQPVTVSLEWDPDALLLTLVNPVPGGTAAGGRAGAGHGLPGLDERVRPVGGMLDHRRSGEGFRLFAMLPADAGEAVPGDAEDDAEEDAVAYGHGLAGVERVRTVVIGVAAAVLMFVILPASLLVGVG
jgi:signal transduction histidine kinase